jgi:allantoinase
MQGMAERGVIGFKAFMCDSGLPEFQRADDGTLYEGLIEAARLGLPVAVHAESEELTRAFSREMTDGTSSAFLRSRPALAEVEAVQRALLLAGAAGAKLHLVHLSCGRSVQLAANARATGVDVSIETCPHYLFFTKDDLARLGTVAKCAPPLRSRREREWLWRELMSDHVDIVASDHSPTEPTMKTSDFRLAWGGIAGVQSTLSVLLTAGDVPVERIAALTSTEPARRFSIAGKGALAAGYDADLAIVDPAAEVVLEASHLQQRHKISPYLGQRFRGRVRRTIRRGETIFLDGQVCAGRPGKFVRPRTSIAEEAHDRRRD